MGKIIAFANKKGGTGKTTSTLAIGQLLAKKGKKILFVDMDAQFNITYTLNADSNKGVISQIFAGVKTAQDCIQQATWYEYTDKGTKEHPTNYDVIATDSSIDDVEAILNNPINKDRKYNVLKEALKGVKSKYDYILIDTPAKADGIATLNAYTCADYIVICTNANQFAYDGTRDLFAIIDDVKTNTNPSIKIAGILITMYKERANLTKVLMEELEKLAKDNGTKIFDSKIRICQAIMDAQAMQMPLPDYAPKSNAVADYEQATSELLKAIK